MAGKYPVKGLRPVRVVEDFELKNLDCAEMVMKLIENLCASIRNMPV